MSNSVGQAFDIPWPLAGGTIGGPDEADVINYTADIWRDIVSMFGTPGRRDGLSLKVTQHAGTPNMSVDIGVGMACVEGTSQGGRDAAGITVQGNYLARLRSTANVNIGTAPTSGAAELRAVYVEIQDKKIIGAGNNEAIIKVQANYTGTLTNPSALLLGTVQVNVNATSITNANITTNDTFALSASAMAAIATLQASIGAQIDALPKGIVGRGVLVGNPTFWTSTVQNVVGVTVHCIAGRSYKVTGNFQGIVNGSTYAPAVDVESSQQGGGACLYFYTTPGGTTIQGTGTISFNCTATADIFFAIVVGNIPNNPAAYSLGIYGGITQVVVEDTGLAI